MKTLICNCRQCRHARRGYHAIARSKVKGARSLVRRLLRQHEYVRLPQRVAGGMRA